MPSSIVEVRCAYSPEEELALMQAVHDALVEAFRIAPAHRNVTLLAHPPHRFLGRPDCETPERLTNVTLYVLPGRSLAAKRALYAGIVRRFAALGIPPACVLIRLLELPPENFGVRGGQPVTDIELGYRLDV